MLGPADWVPEKAGGFFVRRRVGHDGRLPLLADAGGRLELVMTSAEARDATSWAEKEEEPEYSTVAQIDAEMVAAARRP